MAARLYPLGLATWLALFALTAGRERWQVFSIPCPCQRGPPTDSIFLTAAPLTCGADLLGATPASLFGLVAGADADRVVVAGGGGLLQAQGAAAAD